MEIKNNASTGLQTALKRKIMRAAKDIKKLDDMPDFWDFLFEFLIEISDVLASFCALFFILFFPF